MKVSVLMPIYVKENPLFFKQAVDSILAQSLMPEEILIVEDGPLMEGLYKAIEGYLTQYPSLFTVIKLEENRGMGYAMDKGLRACRNDWVARMDSDDIAEVNRLEKQVNFLKQNPDVDIVGSYIEEFNTNRSDLKQNRTVPLLHKEIVEFMKYRNPMNHMTVLMNRKKAMEAGGYWHLRVLEDYSLWYRMMKNGCIFHNLPETLVHARVGNNMVGRRRGMAYVKKELYFFRTMKDDKFITTWEFYKFSFARTIMKLLPVGMLRFLYRTFLRN